MIPCERCGAAPATIHVTRISEDTTSISHLCETCAREKGITVDLQSGSVAAEAPSVETPAARPPDIGNDRECGFCRTKLSDFLATGRLGCARCYQEFEKDVEAFLARQPSGATRGGTPTFPLPMPSAADPEKLRRELADAISAEEFELAALLRDAIRDAEKGTRPGVGRTDLTDGTESEI